MIGIDTVDINRFITWLNYSNDTLSRIFTQEEIDYCKSHMDLSAQRFASRFAAKEAVYKALCNKFLIKLSFLAACKYIEVEKNLGGIPKIKINFLALNCPNCNIEISITHTKDLATAIAFIVPSNSIY